MQFIPARGRKLDGFQVDFHKKLLQFIPARGRKLWRCISLPPGRNCNLSPRGDGNAYTPKASSVMGYCNLSPRGDGNGSEAPRPTNASIAIYPREGTETFLFSDLPAGFPLQFIPARGRKLLGDLRDGHPHQHCNLSPRGDGNPRTRSIFKP